MGHPTRHAPAPPLRFGYGLNERCKPAPSGCAQLWEFSASPFRATLSLSSCASTRYVHAIPRNKSCAVARREQKLRESPGQVARFVARAPIVYHPFRPVVRKAGHSGGSVARLLSRHQRLALGRANPDRRNHVPKQGKWRGTATKFSQPQPHRPRLTRSRSEAEAQVISAWPPTAACAFGYGLNDQLVKERPNQPQL